MKPYMPDIHLMHEANTTLLDMGKIIPAFNLMVQAGISGVPRIWMRGVLKPRPNILTTPPVNAFLKIAG